jgi:hypothetical protein
MSAWLAAGVFVTAAALFWRPSAAPAAFATPTGFATIAGFAPPAAHVAPADESGPQEKVRILDVPYVPQSEALCGGAALAMVLRYWGERAVLAEDFAALVRPGQAGIRTADLAEAARARGWSAMPVSGTPADARSHLAQGRPVIALIQVAPGSFHYVVLVAWANGGVIFHDPAVGPFRVRREGDFDAAWSRSGRSTLLILPPPRATATDGPAPAAPDSSSRTVLDGCDALVEEGIRQAADGDTAGAEARFLAAQSLCPASAAPLRELAGLRFRAEDWGGAARLAERALERDPSDAHAWRLLAGSRFLAGNVEGALRAWNHLAEPRADLTRIDGLVRIRYRAVASQLDLPPGRLLTSSAFVRARRRLAELPASSASRLSLRPLPEGRAQVNVALLERPLLFEGPWDAGGAGLEALTEREVAVSVASPAGNGELWTAGWGFWRERPRVSLGLAAPAVGGRPGIWRVDGFWERQAYAAGTADQGVIREERRRAALSFADWVGADLRLEAGAALDRWTGRGAHLSAEGSIETRWAGDHLALGAQIARWTSLEGGAPFGAGSLRVRWASRDSQLGGWRARAGISRATSKAPLALWPGAGTGHGRAEFLRAHPLLEGGVVAGPAFGRTLVHGGLERQVWAWTVMPLRLGWILFVDTAKPWDTSQSAHVPWQVDGGAGLRLAGLGTRGRFRLDVAHGFEDGKSAVSIGWENQ